MCAHVCTHSVFSLVTLLLSLNGTLLVSAFLNSLLDGGLLAVDFIEGVVSVSGNGSGWN